MQVKAIKILTSSPGDVSEPVDELETALVWRADDSSATVAAFLEVARGAFDSEPRASTPWEPALRGGSNRVRTL